jgi:hypothetical protein
VPDLPRNPRHCWNKHCLFVDLTSIPKDSKITYGKLVCDLKPNKTEKHRVRLAVGGDRFEFSGETATSTADITTLKILINNTLSTADAKMMTMDINNYYVGTPLPTYEYMRLPIAILPLDIIEKYKLTHLAVNGVKLHPLPQPQLRALTYAETNPSAQRVTQLRSVLARVFSVSRQNLNTTTVP